jgi:hypothetical protein
MRAGSPYFRRKFGVNQPIVVRSTFVKECLRIGMTSPAVFSGGVIDWIKPVRLGFLVISSGYLPSLVQPIFRVH